MNSKERSELIIHPLRLRIMNILGQDRMTTGELSMKLRDVPPATLYRHVKKLENAGLISIVDRNQVRGAVEKVYEVKNTKDSQFSAEDMKDFTREDHERYFAAFLGSLNFSFSEHMSVLTDNPSRLALMGYHTYPVKLNPEDLQHFKKGFIELLDKFQKKGLQSENAELFNLSTIILPEGHNESE